MNDKKRLAWFIVARMIVVTMLLVSTFILSHREPTTAETLFLPGLFRLIFVTYLFSILSLALVYFIKQFLSLLSYVQIVWDILLVTALILFTGGVASPYSFLYMLAIISASVLLAKRQAFYAASLCCIFYGAILDLQYFGKLSFIGLTSFSAQQYGANHILFSIFVSMVAFYLTALLSGYLADRVRMSESALKKKVIDYEELEQLNSDIVNSLASGLLTVTIDGRIRVFNPQAEELTGISQEDAYDWPISDIMPCFAQVLEQSNEMFSEETEFPGPDGILLILGYKVVPLKDNDGNRIGSIINFKDLTQIKQMQAELKRADRLAGIGEMAARMAHEIRNPLASISGSVQMIAEGDRIVDTDLKLLEIVMRETERLDLLISDFLDYAKPSVPTRSSVPLNDFFSEFKVLLQMDPRFSRINLRIESTSNLKVIVDRDQLQQVFWNLLVNASEAIPESGIVTIKASLLSADKTDKGGDTVMVQVSDTGHGMTEHQMKRVFEPFFTLKPGGTGLGLATVYRIIEAHGGRITVESKPGVGSTFTVFLPVG